MAFHRTKAASQREQKPKPKAGQAKAKAGQARELKPAVFVL
jgi:hypothetical protein